MLSLRRFALHALAVPATVALAAPANAQMFSDSYQFLEAVRERDGTKAIQLLSGPGGTIINTRDRANGETALHIAVARRDMVWVNFLTQRGADANIANRDGVTPLLSAAQLGFVDGAQALVARGARINHANGRGETALHIAVLRRDIAMVRALMAAGADADQQDNIAGKSPRDYAADDSRGAAILAALTEARAAAPTAPAAAGPN
jgi:ankyrin repeat protein